MRITKSYHFEASHILPHHDGKCARLHGHSYNVELTVAGSLQSEGPATGMVMDFSQISAVVKRRIVAVLDHTHLNDKVENPTCERLVAWIWSQLDEPLPGLEEVTLWETATSRATLRKGDIEAIPA